MRDAYLSCLLFLAAAAAGGYAWLLAWSVRRGEQRDSGCLLGFLGWLALLVVIALLSTVGRAVGVNVSGLTGQ